MINKNRLKQIEDNLQGFQENTVNQEWSETAKELRELEIELNWIRYENSKGCPTAREDFEKKIMQEREGMLKAYETGCLDYLKQRIAEVKTELANLAAISQ
jgi:hypothetical protein